MILTLIGASGLATTMIFADGFSLENVVQGSAFAVLSWVIWFVLTNINVKLQKLDKQIQKLEKMLLVRDDPEKVDRVHKENGDDQS